MNIMRFEMNVPKEVALSSLQGTMIEGRYGNRVMFQLAGGGVMYVPPAVATQIEEEGIVVGEHFELCKAAVREGRRWSIEWRVKRVDAPSQLERDLRASLDAVTEKTVSPPKPMLVPRDGKAEIPHFSPTTKANGNDNHGTPDQKGGGLTPVVTKLEHALKTAITAAHNAERFGSELGYVVRFDSDAIKSMAITVLINMSGEARR